MIKSRYQKRIDSFLCPTISLLQILDHTAKKKSIEEISIDL